MFRLRGSGSALDEALDEASIVDASSSNPPSPSDVDLDSLGAEATWRAVLVVLPRHLSPTTPAERQVFSRWSAPLAAVAVADTPKVDPTENDEAAAVNRARDRAPLDRRFIFCISLLSEYNLAAAAAAAASQLTSHCQKRVL
mmetsp:Transcript_36407/g.109305  ORF Transcript_36407/g.109305 Transcript_36407/m.109305 type:complete len:142 (-) Transcript_36407:71-496(-)